MALGIGTRLGPYEIVSPLGAGGMGEVYRARDTRLGREVAVKVLPEHLTSSSEDRARFKREAKAISSLNHPHICVLHDVGLEGDTDYLVMELIEGETLAQRLTRGPLAPGEVLRLGVQIADALDRAHRAGVVHRDLKPGNVMLTKSGAKLMDFGLARAAARTTMSGGTELGSATVLDRSTRAEEPITAKGMVVGTVHYMAPEQLEGKRTDARCDLWSLGCVLYEMSTGKRAFEGTTAASVISSIMRDQPREMSELSPMAPPSLERLVKGCLVKDPEERIQTAHDVKLQLQWIAEEGSQGAVAAPIAARRRVRVRLAWAWAGVATAAAAVFAIGYVGRTPPRRAPVWFQVAAPAGLTSVTSPEVSPNGMFVAFSATDSTGVSSVWVHSLTSLSVRRLPGTEGAGPPFWSPDSRSIGFFAEQKLKRVATAGGPPQTICSNLPGASGSWGKGGVIVCDIFGADSIARVSVASGVASAATTMNRVAKETMHGLPRLLPDGRHFLFLNYGPFGKDEVGLGVGDLESKNVKTITHGQFSRVEYAAPGYLVFARDQTLMAQKFDWQRPRLTGEPVPILGDVGANVSGEDFSVSGNGALAFREIGADSTRLFWVDRTGRELKTIAVLANRTIISLSPDESRAAIYIDGDIWSIEFSRGLKSRVTFDPTADFSPIWSPDGAGVLFVSPRGDSTGLYEASPSGGGDDVLKYRMEGELMNPADYSADGRYIALLAGDLKTRSEIWALPMFGDRKPKPFLRRPGDFDLRDARFSPDSRWLAYSSMESGRREVYVQAFPGPGGKWQVSTEGGRDPQWRRDGREIFFLSSDGTVMSSDIGTGATFQASLPRPLFMASLLAGGFVGRSYAVSADGQRFLIQRSLPVSTQQPYTVILHWDAGLGRQ